MGEEIRDAVNPSTVASDGPPPFDKGGFEGAVPYQKTANTRRLVKKEPDGTFYIPGVDLAVLPTSLYMAVVKLKDYEDTGLTPDEVERLLQRVRDRDG